MQYKQCIFLFFMLFLIRNTYSVWTYNPYCWLKECCTDNWIVNDINKLRETLKLRVYGQHLVDNVADAVAAHISPNYKPQKALTLSFHGWTGSGKNYVSRFIAESLYKEGTKSKYVHHFVGRIHFPEKEFSLQYKMNLYSWLKGNITNCPRQLFIFDEVDKMAPDVLNAIKPLIDYRDVVDGADYTKAIFIFLSNTGAELINEHYEDFYNSGKKREELRLSDFEKLIQKGAFNEEGWLYKQGFFNKIASNIVDTLHLKPIYDTLSGFYRADPIKSNLIDHYIPFLPMQQNHIELCIRDEFRIRNVVNPAEKHIQEVMEFVEWGPDSNKLFSKTGCKGLSSKVGVLVVKHYPELYLNAKKEL